ncbi:helix-turn-helix transcriptional regulator [Tetragenococcus halophilus]|nr:helix-turn-helix transcriptional regulator [Tetragenococcus halophilus]
MMIEQLKKTREEQDLTIQEVAEYVGISKAYYSMIENGKRGLSYPMAAKIADVFDKKPDDIFFTHEFTNEKLNDKKIGKQVLSNE